VSRVNKFTESQLQQLGFNQLPSGAWSKDGVQTDDSKPQAAESKPNECSAALEKEKDQGCREEGLRYRLVVHSYRTQFIDPSNASMKQIEDCLTLPQGRKNYGIGIFPDDSPTYCDQPLFLQTKVKKDQERTDIEVLCYREEAA